jgi:lipopolysaccharide export system permease protein
MLPLIERYILRRTTYVFLLTFGALVGALWVTQVLGRLDVVTTKGQATWVFLLMTVLALPGLAQQIAPIALLAAAIIALNSLTSDSELPVISAAGASQKAVKRPILVLGTIVMLAVALSHHVLAPASFSVFRELVTRVRADVIATFVQEGGFRTVDDGLTMHIREKAPDGSFRGIFVNDNRDPNLSLQFSAGHGMLLPNAGGTFLVLRGGDLIREDRATGESNVVRFETYALDLSQLGSANAAVYESQERSTMTLLNLPPDDPYLKAHPQRVTAELHDRITAPLYTLVFALVALAFLAQPRTNRQDRSLAIAAVVLLCLALRVGGFAAWAVARNVNGAVPFMYAIPLAGLVIGAYAATRDARLRIPLIVEIAFDEALRVVRRLVDRYLRNVRMAEGEQP